MRSFKRLIRMVLPAVILLAALELYLVDVKPLTRLNRERQATLSSKAGTFESLVDEKGFYPTIDMLDSLDRLAKETYAVIQEMMAGAPRTEDYQNQLKYIFTGWGYPQTHPAYLEAERFKTDAARQMGREKEESADLLAKALAVSFCRAEIGRFENLTVVPVEAEPGHGRERLGIFDVEIAFNAGITESIQFVEECILTSGGGFLIHPEQITIKRLDPGQWLEDIKHYSGPPVRLELRVRVIFTVDKGRS
jgi:hypothetical protein